MQYKIPREMMPKWYDIAVRANISSRFEIGEQMTVEIITSKDCQISLHCREIKPVTLDEAELYVHEQFREGRLTRRAIRDDIIEMIGNLEAIHVLEKYGLLEKDDYWHRRY